MVGGEESLLIRSCMQNGNIWHLNLAMIAMELGNLPPKAGVEDVKAGTLHRPESCMLPYRLISSLFCAVTAHCIPSSARSLESMADYQHMTAHAIVALKAMRHPFATLQHTDMTAPPFCFSQGDGPAILSVCTASSRKGSWLE